MKSNVSSAALQNFRNNPKSKSLMWISTYDQSLLAAFFFMIFKRKTHIDVLYVDEKLFWWTPRLKSSHVTQEASSCGEIKAQPHKKQFTFTTPNMNYSHLSYSPPVLLPFTDRKLSQSFLACNTPELQNSVPFVVERLTISSMPRKASSIVWL